MPPTPVKKPGMLLVIGGFLVLIGIGLSVYDVFSIIKDLSTQENQLGIGMSMEISKVLDPTINENGAYVLQIIDFKEENSLDVSVYDPSDQLVVSKSIDKSSFQDSFKISTNGIYKLKVENNGERELEVVAAIGYFPKDESSIMSKFGVVITIVGLICLATGIVHFIKSRRSYTN